MRRTIFLALMAAAAIAPAMASAQDRGRWGGRGNDDPSSARPAPERAQRGNGGNTGGTPAARPNRGGNGDFAGNPAGWRGQRGNAAAPAANATPQAQPETRTRGGWNGNNNGGGNNGGGWRGQRGNPATPGANPDVQAQSQAQAQAQAQAETRARGNRGNGDWNRNGNGGYRGNQNPQAQVYRGNNGYQRPEGAHRKDDRGRDTNRWQGNRGGNDGWRWNGNRNNGRWDRNWRGAGSYNWQGYRSSNRNAFRLPRYYAPSGWGYGYRRFTVGSILNSLLFADSYWINDPYAYRLPDVYGPYRWVRYYNDALLVDIYTGQVVDEVNDIFW